MQIITKQQAIQFILSKQGLIGAYRFAGKEGAYAYIRQAGCIQYDPVDVCGKNAELTLQSRVKGFRKTMLNELLYKDRLLVDYPDKELSIWPVEDWPYFSSYRECSIKSGRSFKEISKLRKQALSYIGDNGPVSSSSLPIEGEIYWHSSMHWSGNWDKKSPAARSILEQLYTDGELIIHHKNGNRKFYDLASKHIPADILYADNPCDDEFSFLVWRVLRRIGAIGLLWDKNSTALLGISINADTRKRILSFLTDTGRILPVKVEGIKPIFYFCSEDNDLMNKILEGTADLKPRMSFIAPLDPLMWDKSLVFSLWEYRYSWEIYTPVIKRKYGYYTLPILLGENFIGRIETAVERNKRELIVKDIWLESGIRHTKELQRKLMQTLKLFAEFNECKKIQFDRYSERITTVLSNFID